MADNRSRAPQLRMRRGLADLPPVALPPGHTLRRGGPEDAERWIALLNANAELGDWDLERAARVLADGIDPGRIWFVETGGATAATACVKISDMNPRPETEIGWVAVHPDCRGRRLGAQVTLAACHCARELGFGEAFLLTDDHRLPALKTYLNLGFVPDCWHESHTERWRAITAALQRSAPSTGT